MYAPQSSKYTNSKQPRPSIPIHFDYCETNQWKDQAIESFRTVLGEMVTKNPGRRQCSFLSSRLFYHCGDMVGYGFLFHLFIYRFSTCCLCEMWIEFLLFRHSAPSDKKDLNEI